MTSPNEPTADDELQFQTAEPAVTDAATPVVQGCANCGRPITGEYFAVGPHPICPACRTQLEPQATGTRFTRLLKATGLGLAAGLLGALIWYVVRRVTNLEIGLIAILVGFMVGKAVRIGSGNRGGLRYQFLAVVLTYCCIAANYMPDIAQELFAQAHNDATTNAPGGAAADGTGASAAKGAGSSAADTSGAASDERPSVLRLVGAILLLAGIVFGISLAAPFLMGAQNIIGLLIIAFALWEAWKFNRKVILPITGPYQLGTGPIGAPGIPAGGSVI